MTRLGRPYCDAHLPTLLDSYGSCHHTKDYNATERYPPKLKVVKEGLVNGAEYYAINNPEKVNLWGVEDVDRAVMSARAAQDAWTNTP